MLLVLCAVGACLLTAAAAVSFGPGAALAVAGVGVIAWAVLWDLLLVDDEADHEADG